jgi:hypothetical protein
MGYTEHHAILVTSYSAKDAADAHTKAVELGCQVTLAAASRVNSYVTFVVLPDGSKENWPQSTDGDTRRARFKDWLRTQRFDDQSSPLSWVEVCYGSDHFYAGGPGAEVTDSEWKDKVHPSERIRG